MTRLPARTLLATLVCLGLAAPPLAGGAVTTAYADSARSVAALPGGGQKVFGGHRFLFAHYGFANPSSTFILGQRTPDRAFAKMRKQGRAFRQRGERVLPVYELVVTIADADPGSDGNYNHDLLHSKVQEYVEAAHRNGALLILDLQPGRESFLDVAKRWEWTLQDPWVGLGLDTEWRMGPDEVPGQDVGSVTAKELNRTSGWLARLVKRSTLPQKLFLWHQYKVGNVKHVGSVKRRPSLALVQHVDAAGSPAAKRATYRTVARPGRFTTGLMVFLDADSPRMRPKAVRAVDDAIRFVSYQ